MQRGPRLAVDIDHAVDTEAGDPSAAAATTPVISLLEEPPRIARQHEPKRLAAPINSERCKGVAPDPQRVKGNQRSTADRAAGEHGPNRGATSRWEGTTQLRPVRGHERIRVLRGENHQRHDDLPRAPAESSSWLEDGSGVPFHLALRSPEVEQLRLELDEHQAAKPFVERQEVDPAADRPVDDGLLGGHQHAGAREEAPKRAQAHPVNEVRSPRLRRRRGLDAGAGTRGLEQPLQRLDRATIALFGARHGRLRDAGFGGQTALRPAAVTARPDDRDGDPVSKIVSHAGDHGNGGFIGTWRALHRVAEEGEL